MGFEPKYSSDAERRAAANRREYLRDLPRKLIVNRRRHADTVKEIKRAGMHELLTEEEKNWS